MKKIIITIFIIFLLLNYRNLNLGFLTMYSLDEFAFYGSLNRMYEGFVNLNIKGLFSYGFYSYGFLYFLTKLIIALPFFYNDSPELVIYSTRMLSALFACGSLYLIISTISKTNKTIQYLLVFIIISMPGFWKNALWNHPDWMMTFFVLASIFYLSKANDLFSTKYWLSILMFSIAVSIKVQALMFIPILFGYILNNYFKRINNIPQIIKISTITGALIFIIFILSNPYILHPDGLEAFLTSFKANMKSNATNHGSGEFVTFQQKLSEIIFTFYFNALTCIALFLASLYSLYKKRLDLNLYNILTYSSILSLTYLFLFVNKNWQHYYLPIMLIMTIPISQIKINTNKYTIMFFGSIVFIQLIGAFPIYKKQYKEGYNQKITNNLSYNLQVSKDIIQKIGPSIKPDENILMEPYIPFEFQKVHLKYNNIKLILGPLREEMFNKSSHDSIHSQKPFVSIHYIILKKNSIYFDPNLIAQMTERNSYESACKLIENLDHPDKTGFQRFAETAEVIIWKKSNP